MTTWRHHNITWRHHNTTWRHSNTCWSLYRYSSWTVLVVHANQVLVVRWCITNIHFNLLYLYPKFSRSRIDLYIAMKCLLLEKKLFDEIIPARWLPYWVYKLGYHGYHYNGYWSHTKHFYCEGHHYSHFIFKICASIHLYFNEFWMTRVMSYLSRLVTYDEDKNTFFSFECQPHFVTTVLPEP